MSSSTVSLREKTQFIGRQAQVVSSAEPAKRSAILAKIEQDERQIAKPRLTVPITHPVALNAPKGSTAAPRLATPKAGSTALAKNVLLKTGTTKLLNC
ncbi:MAG: hypothetical protein R3C68_04430 [Myxococcota bacterium]